MRGNNLQVAAASGTGWPECSARGSSASSVSVPAVSAKATRWLADPGGERGNHLFHRFSVPMARRAAFGNAREDECSGIRKVTQMRRGAGSRASGVGVESHQPLVDSIRHAVYAARVRWRPTGAVRRRRAPPPRQSADIELWFTSFRTSRNLMRGSRSSPLPPDAPCARLVEFSACRSGRMRRRGERWLLLESLFACTSALRLVRFASSCCYQDRL